MYVLLEAINVIKIVMGIEMGTKRVEMGWGWGC